MATGDIALPGMESPGGGNCTLRPLALCSRFDLGKNVVHSVAHKPGNRQTPLRRKRPQAKVLLFRQLYLRTYHTNMMAPYGHHDNSCGSHVRLDKITSSAWVRSTAFRNGCGQSMPVGQYTSTVLPSGSAK